MVKLSRVVDVGMRGFVVLMLAAFVTGCVMWLLNELKVVDWEPEHGGWGPMLFGAMFGFALGFCWPRPRRS